MKVFYPQGLDALKGMGADKERESTFSFSFGLSATPHKPRF